VVGVAVLQLQNGGYDQAEWGAAALFVLGLLAVALVAGLLSPPTGRPAAVSLACFAAYAVWGFASIAWAEVKGDALEGASRTLLYLAAFALVTLIRWPRETPFLLLASFVVLTAAIGLGSIVAAALASDPHAFFIAGRFSEPMGYQNGNCALFLMGAFGALPLAARREVPVFVRGLLIACAGVLLELAAVTQSRTSLVAAPVVLAALLVVSRDRGRIALAAVLPALAVVVCGDALLDVFTAVREGSADPAALDTAATCVAVTGAVLLVLGTALALADRRVELSPAAERVIRGVAIAAVALAGVAAVVVVATRADHPIRSVEDAWSSFTDIEDPGAGREVESSYLASGLGGNRYDLWRVALLEFRDHPVVGVGSENFAVGYLRERRTFEETLHPHSLPLRALAQTGVVGALLLAVALGAAVFAGVLAVRRGGLPGAAAASGLAVFGYWLVHGSADWFWELAGLGLPAIVALGLAVAGTRADDGDRPPGLSTLASAGLGAGIVLSAVVLVPTWLAAKETEVAGDGWRDDPAAAFRRLERARSLNPLSERPDLYAALIAGKVGDEARMRRHLDRAIERKPASWYAHFELGLLAGVTGDRDASLRELAAADRLNPLEPAIDEVRRRVAAGEEVTLAEYDQVFLARARAVGR
jgi:hypothetical protein